MQDLPVLLAIIGFTVMGVGAIAKPNLVTAQFGILELTPAGRWPPGELPDTPTVTRALELAQRSVPVWLCRHGQRC
jgi:hypothetical protein